MACFSKSRSKYVRNSKLWGKEAIDLKSKIVDTIMSGKNRGVKNGTILSQKQGAKKKPKKKHWAV